MNDWRKFLLKKDGKIRINNNVLEIGVKILRLIWATKQLIGRLDQFTESSQINNQGTENE
jgi:hypothetical protein